LAKSGISSAMSFGTKV